MTFCAEELDDILAQDVDLLLIHPIDSGSKQDFHRLLISRLRERVYIIDGKPIPMRKPIQHGRVRLGGHHISKDVIRRRYETGWRNFFDIYQP